MGLAESEAEVSSGPVLAVHLTRRLPVSKEMLPVPVPVCLDASG